MIKNLIDNLNIPNTDYWYDSVSDLARNIIDDNYDQTFSILLLEWRAWPENTQEHLAYILGEGSSVQELALINEMLTSDYESVVFRAKESLIEFNQKT